MNIKKLFRELRTVSRGMQDVVFLCTVPFIVGALITLYKPSAPPPTQLQVAEALTTDLAPTLLKMADSASTANAAPSVLPTARALPRNTLIDAETPVRMQLARTETAIRAVQADLRLATPARAATLRIQLDSLTDLRERLLRAGGQP